MIPKAKHSQETKAMPKCYRTDLLSIRKQQNQKFGQLLRLLLPITSICRTVACHALIFKKAQSPAPSQPLLSRHATLRDETKRRLRISVFTVTQSKIKLQTIQFRKSRIQEINEDKYAKGLAQNQVCAIFHMRDIGKKVLPKFIKLRMEMPCLCPFVGHKYGRPKPTKTSVFEFSY